MPHTAATPSVIIASKKVGSAKTPPVPVIQVIIPDDVGKLQGYSGTKFLKTKQTALSRDSRPFDEIIAGDKVPLAIPNLFGATLFGVDPAKRGSTTPADADKKKASISFDLAACGEFGQALDILCSEFLEQVQAPAVLAKLWTDADKKPQFPCPVKRTYGKKSTKAGPDGKPRAGKPRESAVVELKLPFGNFPASFGERANKPRVSVYDWTTRSMNAKGEETFKEQQDETGATFSSTNFEKIIRPGDIVRRIHLIIEGASIYGDGISLRLSVYKIWTERGVSSGDILGDDEPAPAATSAVPLPIVAAAAAPKSKVPQPADDTFVGDDEEGEGVIEDEDEEDESKLH